MKYMKRLTGHTSLGLNSTRQSIFNHPYAKTIFLSVILGWSAHGFSANRTTYKSVYTGESYTSGNRTYQNKHAQIRDRVLGQTRPDPYAQLRNNPYNRYPNYPDYYPNHFPNGYPHDFPNGHGNHGTQVYIGTPHVQIHVQPETQTHYQSTEEVYLPYGGTYRKTTESIAKYPAYSQYGYPYSNTQNKRTYGKVIQQGKYQSD